MISSRPTRTVYESSGKMDLAGGKDIVESDGKKSRNHLIEAADTEGCNGNGRDVGDIEEGDAMGNVRYGSSLVSQSQNNFVS